MTAVVFLLVRACLCCVHFVVARRASSLEKRHAILTCEAEKLATPRAITLQDSSWLSAARAQQKLLAAADRLEVAEAKWQKTQALSDRLAGWRAWMAGDVGKSRLAWYACAVFDVACSTLVSEKVGQHASRLLSLAMESAQAWL